MNHGDTMFLLYSDFNCPFCYALHERLHDLNLIDRCEWRGVQHAPHLPRPMKPWNGALGVELRHEVSVVRRLAPSLPISLPSGKPNTLPAIQYAITLLHMNHELGMRFIRETYRAFWQEGKDISNPTVLNGLAGRDLGGTLDDDSLRIAYAWDSAWRDTGHGGVPLIVSPRGDILIGCVPEDTVRRFFV
ncbi:DsbA family oxidoreductase [Candidatus Nitrospira inopinata]|jgi:2-hydroxychromene-2-carboxylate isomerase|uniref:DSBA-like thioredoxin domain-containing protein n=1 Tax=Candidatus Nitrospira inopinata TaxID=1715989 RepID=A0A0S4KTW5_9BACT|nr:DsbA family protein [Candidatus Nitrospira inopinata]CUQ67889.1 conserved protein of unknown function [Candidatus Nitrospira inopinata]